MFTSNRRKSNATHLAISEFFVVQGISYLFDIIWTWVTYITNTYTQINGHLTHIQVSHIPMLYHGQFSDLWNVEISFWITKTYWVEKEDKERRAKIYADSCKYNVEYTVFLEPYHYLRAIMLYHLKYVLQVRQYSMMVWYKWSFYYYQQPVWYFYHQQPVWFWSQVAELVGREGMGKYPKIKSLESVSL